MQAHCHTAPAGSVNAVGTVKIGRLVASLNLVDVLWPAFVLLCTNRGLAYFTTIEAFSRGNVLATELTGFFSDCLSL